jgi:hypothetical protein
MISEKIRPHHLQRKALLYVRQSSAHQVLHNRESSALQCESACNKDPVFGVIGIETGPRPLGVTLASIVFGSRGLDVGCGNNCKDSTGVFQAG